MNASHRQALAAFERNLLRKNRAPTTRERLVATARLFLERTPAPLARLAAGEVRLYLAGRSREIGAVSQEGEVYRLRSFFSALVEEGLLGASPMEGIEVPRAHRPQKRALSLEDVRRMLVVCEDAPGRGGYVSRACRCRDRACLELLYGLGLRRSEVIAARTRDLSLADQTLLVRPAKLGKPRTLPLPPKALPALGRYLREARPVLAARAVEPSDHLLLAKNGRPLEKQNVNLLVRRIGKRAGVRGVHPHAFRRALATHLIRAGVSERVVQLLLGHAKLTTTATYLSVEREELRRTIAILERDREA